MRDATSAAGDAGRSDEAAILRDAVHEYFARRVVAAKRRLRELFHRGRISLAIALAFLAASIAIGDVFAHYLGQSRLASIVRDPRRGTPAAAPQYDAGPDRVRRSIARSINY